MIAAANAAADARAARPPMIAWPNARASRPWTLDRHVARGSDDRDRPEDQAEDDRPRRQERDLARVADRERIAEVQQRADERDDDQARPSR